MALNDLHDFLARATGCEDLGKIAAKLGLVTQPEDLSLRIIEDWHRGGAETFIMVFTVEGPSLSKKLLLKACTPFSPAVPIEDVLAKWLRRRKFLEASGCLAPHLYGTLEGTLIEEYIPDALSDFELGRWNEGLTRDLMHYAQVLAANGFCALSPFSDLRTDGWRVYVVDFGEDLGDPMQQSSIIDYSQIAVNWLAHKGIQGSTPIGYTGKE